MTTPSRRGRRLAPLVMAAALVLGGCTVSGGEDDPTQAPDQPSTRPSTTTSQPEEDEADGASNEELSAAVLALGAEQPAPLASQTLQVPGRSGSDVATVTVDVLELRRRTDSTLLRLQLSSPTPGTKIENIALDTDRNSEFFDRFGLEDTTSGVRYLPLAWNRGILGDAENPDGPVDSCVCGYRASNFTLGPEPIVMDFLYGPLPQEVSSVTLTAPDGLSVPDLAVPAA